MKDLFNDLSSEEKNSIREQHTGGKKITIENFSNMVNKKLGEVPTLLSEQMEDINLNGSEGHGILDDLKELLNTWNRNESESDETTNRVKRGIDILIKTYGPGNDSETDVDNTDWKEYNASIRDKYNITD